MASTISLSILSLLICLVAYIYFSVSTSVHAHTHQDTVPLPNDVAGPILLGAATGARLEGLTLLRTVKLPVIVFTLPGLGQIQIKNSTSELVFKTLRVSNVSMQGRDAAKEVVNISAVVNANLTCTTSVRVEMHLNLSWIGLKPKVYRSTTAGKLSTKLSDMEIRLPLRLAINKEGLPRLVHNSLRVHSGSVSSLSFSAAPMASYAAHLPASLTVQPVANFLLGMALNSHDIHEALAALTKQTSPYLDHSFWQLLSPGERAATPPSLISTTSGFQAYGSIRGRTNLVSIVLPDASPNMYKEGGKLKYLQSWNKLTGEVKLDIKQNIIRNLSFQEAVLEWNTPTARGKTFGQEQEGARIMVCRLEGLNVEMTSSIALYANTSTAIRIVSGMTSFGDSGQSRTLVRAAAFELIFSVKVSEAGVALSTLAVDDFDSLDVSLEGLKYKTGDAIINQIMKVVKPHIATVAGMLVKRFLESEVKKGTEAIEKLEEALLVQGVEVPGLFRLRKVE